MVTSELNQKIMIMWFNTAKKYAESELALRSAAIAYTRTLTAEDLDAHARVAVPVHGVKLDEASDDWFIQVRVLHRVRVDVALKHLLKQYAA